MGHPVLEMEDPLVEAMVTAVLREKMVERPFKTELFSETPDRIESFFFKDLKVKRIQFRDANVIGACGADECDGSHDRNEMKRCVSFKGSGRLGKMALRGKILFDGVKNLADFQSHEIAKLFLTK